jgi:N-acetylneuraminic acid mutarotase
MKRKALALIFILALLMLAVAGALSVYATENSWVEKAPMQQSRASFGVAVVNGKIYAIGGSYTQTNGNESSSVTTNTTEAYDPTTNTWTTKAPMPIPRANFAIAVCENKIYVIGGIIEGKRLAVTNATEVYDPATDTWAEKASIPLPEQSFSANVIGGKIYVVGGQYQPDPVYWTFDISKQTQVYDPSTDSWTTKAPIPIAVAGYVSAVVDNKIYVISGFMDSDITDLTQIYDPEGDKWSSGASIPIGVSGAAAGATTGAAAPKAIYVIGGGYASDPLHGHNLTQVYFPENNSWSMGVSMPTVRGGLSVAVVNDTLYAIGGGYWVFQWDSTHNEQYTPFGYGTIPEFPSFLILPLFMIATLLAGVIYRRKHNH